MIVMYSNALVLRIGGQTTDSTVLAVNSGMYRVCGTVAIPDLGGSIIDCLLVEHFASEFQRFVGLNSEHGCRPAFFDISLE